MSLSEKVENLTRIAKEIRKDILLQVYSANSGHPGGALSCADILTAIYFDAMNEGDKFILSKGHASAALYGTLAEKGLISKEELGTFRKLGSRLQGHPSMRKFALVDSSSGSLGQGLSIANGIAIGFKLDKKENNVYVVLGDGEIQEGQIWEAAMTASHYNLSNVIAFLDYNKLQIDGANDAVMTVKPVDEKFKSFGWNVQVIDGHNFEEILDAIKNAKTSQKPNMIIANTIKRKGISFMEDKCEWHGKAPNKEQYEMGVAELQ